MPFVNYLYDYSDTKIQKMICNISFQTVLKQNFNPKIFDFKLSVSTSLWSSSLIKIFITALCISITQHSNFVSIFSCFQIEKLTSCYFKRQVVKLGSEMFQNLGSTIMHNLVILLLLQAKPHVIACFFILICASLVLELEHVHTQHSLHNFELQKLCLTRSPMHICLFCSICPSLHV